ncbi:uncharacterized protein LOC130591423 [Beta vulgaris subsp. vulgaris]|uniref:uncharacterized protein LOC130591423 n=1 Tax=Beta vulgaris subsp. vulgaris TaxID=3555 RepID=UPI0025473ADF|nr:uncharacterized protein LOC130591423 [Beta vulgaris subsp. vulgaris]
MENVRKIQEKMKEAQDRQKKYADLRRRKLEFEEGEVYLKVHNVFHVSQLRKYVHDPSHILTYEPLRIDEPLSYEERPVRILDKREKVLRNQVIPLVWEEKFSSQRSKEINQSQGKKKVGEVLRSSVENQDFKEVYE